jgi:hypothetical protein
VGFAHKRLEATKRAVLALLALLLLLLLLLI